MYSHLYCYAIHNSQAMESTKMSIIGWGMKKMWLIGTTEYSAMKKNGILSFVLTWIRLVGLMLSEAGTEKQMAHSTAVYSIPHSHMEAETWEGKKEGFRGDG